MSAYRPAVSAAQEDDFMSNLLGNLDHIPVDPIPQKPSRKRKPSPPSDSESESPVKRPDYKSYRRSGSSNGFSSDGPDHETFSLDDQFSSPFKKPRVHDPLFPASTVEQFNDLDVQSEGDSYDDINMDDFMDIDEDDIGGNVKKETVELPIPTKPKPKATPFKKEEHDVKPNWLSVYDSLSVAADDSLGPLTTSASSNTTSSSVSALEKDGSLRFFWLDYMELDGKLYFIGKLKDKVTHQWISCCVTVNNLQRNLFVLPREKRVEQDEDGEMHDTDIIPTEEDVHDDFDLIRKAMGIKSWGSKFVKRNYAFGDKEVPRGSSQWMKVVYGFNGTHLLHILPR